jgi:tetratricopeptide (TPR) repeat protein
VGAIVLESVAAIVPGIGGGNRPGIGGGNRPGIGGGNRPGIGGGNRPGIGGGNRPGIGGGNRPGIGGGNRPGIRGIGGGNRPGIGGGNRPGQGTGSRPGIGSGNRPGGSGNRPGIGGGNRPGSGGGKLNGMGDIKWPGSGVGQRPGGGINSRPNRPGNRPNWNWGNEFQIGDNHQMNNFVNNINNNFTHISNNYNVFNPRGWNSFSTNWNRYNHWGSWHRRAPYYGSWYHGSWNGNFGSGWGYAAGLATSALVSSWAIGPTVYNSGYYSYSNPYYTQPLVINLDGGQQTVIQYDQPLQSTPVETYDGPDQIEVTTVPEPSVNEMDQARDAFASGDYRSALKFTNGALATSPNDPLVHQFRALVLFALKDYRQATAALYSVLSVGPPWDWTTMSGLYPNTDVYTEQFHQLEDFTAANPDAAYAHFLTGYHYMVCGYNDQSIEEFKLAYKLEPSDRLAANLVTMLGGSLDDSDSTGGDSTQPDVQESDTEIVEVEPTQIFGRWITDRNNGPNIKLVLTEEGKFTWTVGPSKTAKILKGEFSLGGDKLALQPDEGGPMMGTVTLNKEGFNFRIVGAPPGDKGLQFQRQ